YGEVPDGCRLRHQVDRGLDARLRFDPRPQLFRIRLADLAGQESLLARVAAEDVAEAWAQHGRETVVTQRPDSVLAAGAGAEVGAGDEHARILELRAVQHELRILPPRVEERVIEAGLGDALEEHRGDDLVGVDVGALERHGDAADHGDLLHYATTPAPVVELVETPPPSWLREISTGSIPELCRSHGLESVPRMAVAAATRGDTRWVRPPFPCRPSKLRLEVEAQRSPGANWSGFMPRHIEQPAKRPSAPTSMRTRAEPGTTMTRTPSAFFWPLTIEAKARRSSMRELVQEPMKTASTAISFIGVPAAMSMYSSARSAAARSFGSL